MKALVSFLVIAALTGCGNMVKGGAIIGAEKALEERQYNDALSKAEVAEHMMGEATRDEIAKINYIRGSALEGLGKTKEAIARFRYVAEHLTGTPHAYLARAKLKSMSDLSNGEKQGSR